MGKKDRILNLCILIPGIIVICFFIVYFEGLIEIIMLPFLILFSFGLIGNIEEIMDMQQKRLRG